MLEVPSVSLKMSLNINLSNEVVSTYITISWRLMKAVSYTLHVSKCPYQLVDSIARCLLTLSGCEFSAVAISLWFKVIVVINKICSKRFDAVAKRGGTMANLVKNYKKVNTMHLITHNVQDIFVEIKVYKGINHLHCLPTMTNSQNLSSTECVNSATAMHSLFACTHNSAVSRFFFSASGKALTVSMESITISFARLIIFCGQGR